MVKIKLYDVIYADPPWKYQRNWITLTRPIENHYPTMFLEDIKKLKIPAKKNAILYLWTTAPKIQEALEVMNSWGFEYKSQLIWNKMKLGLGHWFRINHELLLVGVKGTFPTPPPSLRIQSIYNEKKGKHSKKPNYIRSLIKKWYPEADRLEMFARQKFKGWDVWGNEVNTGWGVWNKWLEKTQ